jgi:TolA-binding protein
MALLRSGRTRAAERFLARATPAPLEDPSSAFLQGEIERSRGAWAAAARAYAAARAGPRAEQSTFLEALCLGRAGDRAGARRGMQAFLRAFPSGRFADRARAALGEMNP